MHMMGPFFPPLGPNLLLFAIQISGYLSLPQGNVSNFLHRLASSLSQGSIDPSAYHSFTFIAATDYLINNPSTRPCLFAIVSLVPCTRLDLYKALNIVNINWMNQWIKRLNLYISEALKRNPAIRAHLSFYQTWLKRLSSSSKFL